jgi:hypothetical protein
MSEVDMLCCQDLAVSSEVNCHGHIPVLEPNGEGVGLKYGPDE